MTPIRTAETTQDLQPAPGDEGRVDPLPVFRTADAIASIWEPTEEEYRDIARGGRIGVQLEVLGDCPPVRLSIVTLHDTPMVLERSVYMPGDLEHPAEQIRQIVDDVRVFSPETADVDSEPGAEKETADGGSEEGDDREEAS